MNISKRNEDTINICQQIINTVIEDKVNYVIFLGDLYDRQTISPTIRKIIRNKIFKPLNKHNVPVIILGGNHDSIRNPIRGADIEELSNFPNVSVYTEFSTKIIELENGKKLGLLLLPFVYFDVLVEKIKKDGISIPEGQDHYIIAQKIIKSYISQICETELKDCDKRVLIGHYYLEGAKIREISNPSMLYGEFRFNKEMVQRELFDLVMFGHVHLRQDMWSDPRIVILGSIDRLDFGERDSEKEYCVYYPEKDEEDLEFRKIECRKLFKIEIEIPDNIEDYTEYILNNLPKKEQLTDSLCKIIIKVPRAKENNIDKNKIDALFKKSFYADVEYIGTSGEELQHLREVNLDPISLYNDFLNQKYSNNANFTDLKNIGVNLLEREFKAVELLSNGPLTIKSVELQNFNNYGRGPNRVSFDEDMYVIKGPTGCGKSSILDAITFALFKRSSRKDVGLNIDEILYKDGYVKLDVEIGDKLFSIKRSDKNPKLVVKVDGEPFLKDLKVSELEKKIVDVIGYDYDGFKSSFFIRQQELQIFSSLHSKERQELLAKLFKLKIFENADAQAKEILKDLEKNQATIEGEIKGYEEIIKELPALQDESEKLSITLKGLESKRKEINSKIKTINESIKKLTPDYDEHERISALSKELSNTIEKNRKEFEKSKEGQMAYVTLQNKLKDFDNINTEKENLENQKENIDINLQEKQKIENEINTKNELLNSEKKRFNKRKAEIKAQIVDSQSRIKAIKADITKDDAFNILKEDGKLNERLDRLQNIEIIMAKKYKDQDRLKEFLLLEKKTKEDLKTIIPKQKFITKDIFISDELKETLKLINNRYNDIEKEEIEKLTEYEDSIKVLKDLLIEKKLNEDLEKQQTQIRKNIIILKAKEKEKGDIEKKLKNIPDYSLLIKKYESDLKSGEQKLKEYYQNLEKLAPAYDLLNKNLLDLETFKDELREIEKDISYKNAEIKKIKENITKISEIKEKIKKNEKDLEELRRNIEIYGILRKEIFHLNGVPKFAIKKILPEIAIKASEILSELTDGKLNQIVFKELESPYVGFDIYVNDGEQIRSADSFSGGEKTQINASIRFAIMEQIAEIPDTAGAIFRKSNMLFIDEGDLGTLDEETARPRFVEKIFELKSKFKKIILITHLEDVAEQFPNLIRVGKDSTGKSRIFT